MSHSLRYICNLALLNVLCLAYPNAQALNTQLHLPIKQDLKSLPSFSSNKVKNSPQERSSGRLFFTTIKQYHKVFKDLTLQQYISSLGNLLVNNAQISQPNYTFFVLDNPSINAFAGPAEYIGIHSGLILQSDSESELASVMAHEIAHQKQQHLNRLSKQISNDPLSNPLLIAGMLVAGMLTENVTISAAGAFFAVGKGMNQQLSHSRQFESEADRVGLKILTNSNFSGAGAINLLKKINSGQKVASVYLSTHPLSSKRIRNLQTLVQNPKPLRASEEFNLIQARVYALSNEKPTHLSPIQNHYQALFETLKTQNLIEFDKLWKKYPDYQQKTYFQLLNTNRYLQLNDKANAEKTLAKLHFKIPNHLQFINYQITLLLQQNKANQALRILHKKREFHPLSHHGYLWEMTQRVYQWMQKRLGVIEARSRASFHHGYVRRSLGLLDDAIKIAEKQQNTSKILALKNLYNDYHQQLYSRVKPELKSP